MKVCCLLGATVIGLATATAAEKAGGVTAHSQGLHGYIGFGQEQPPAQSDFHAGMGFYAAVWPLADRPLADFQSDLPPRGLEAGYVPIATRQELPGANSP